MDKKFLELVKKGFEAFKDADTLYFTKDGKAFAKKGDAETAAKKVVKENGKQDVTVDEGYTVVNRTQVALIEADLIAAASQPKEA